VYDTHNLANEKVSASIRSTDTRTHEPRGSMVEPQRTLCSEDPDSRRAAPAAEPPHKAQQYNTHVRLVAEPIASKGAPWNGPDVFNVTGDRD